jgi:polyhydroxyalkanoate synthesis regulator phasin
MYVTGQQAMEKVMEAISKRIKEGAEIKTYDEFFRLWTEINEDEYFELFKTEEFSNIQGTMLDSALDARRHIHQLMELYLEDYPIALRSEMNDVYKTVHDLRRKVRELDKKIASMPGTKEVKA